MMNDLERINGASYGTSGIIKKFMDLVLTRKTFQIDTLLVNALTIFRNVYEKDMSLSDLSSQFDVDINALTYQFYNYVSQLKQRDHPSIIFYIPSYHTVPLFYLREESDSNNKIYKLFETIIKNKIDQTRPTESFYNDLKIVFIYTGKHNLPHLDVLKQLPMFITDCDKKMFRNYTMISHVPLDYHINNKLHTFCVMDSYTGNVWKYSDLGMKIFKHDRLPFNEYTHVMLGDKFLLKCLLNRRDKKNIFNSATQNNWRLKTKQQILKLCSDVIPESVLTKIKL